MAERTAVLHLDLPLSPLERMRLNYPCEKKCRRMIAKQSQVQIAGVTSMDAFEQCTA